MASHNGADAAGAMRLSELMPTSSMRIFSIQE
jgi:hypothetical protein